MTDLSRRALLLGAAATPLATQGCSENPYLGRRQLILISAAEEARLGEEAWQKLQTQTRRSTDQRLTQRLEAIARRVVDGSGATGLNWQFAVFENRQVNAFALPGGRIGVYTGMFSAVQNDAQLACVLGHEVAHVLARHGAERYSQQQATNWGIALVSLVLGLSTPIDPELAARVLGLGAEFGVLLPYSRDHEFEADRLGTHTMARAGYDPREAVRFWEAMTRRGGGAPPEFLSTHPSDDSRIAALRGLTSEVMGVYQQRRVG
ncbi:MAG: M48 family metallopeptidase [Alphaproteobacteria bacterium]|nr:M48 family metallopeptidase [Alphaproteobacteria bacterium]